jgi:hypothetical protein
MNPATPRKWTPRTTAQPPAQRPLYGAPERPLYGIRPAVKGPLPPPAPPLSGAAPAGVSGSLRPLPEVEVFRQALALFPALPDQPAALRREALELVAALGGGLICGEPDRLLKSLIDARVAVGRISALLHLLAPACHPALEPDLHQLNRALGYFLRYMRTPPPSAPEPAAGARRAPPSAAAPACTPARKPI